MHLYDWSAPRPGVWFVLVRVGLCLAHTVDTHWKGENRVVLSWYPNSDTEGCCTRVPRQVDLFGEIADNSVPTEHIVLTFMSSA